MPRKEKSTIQESEPLHLRPENAAAKMWLWVCVGGISIIILVLWGQMVPGKPRSFVLC